MYRVCVCVCPGHLLASPGTIMGLRAVVLIPALVRQTHPDGELWDNDTSVSPSARPSVCPSVCHASEFACSALASEEQRGDICGGGNVCVCACLFACISFCVRRAHKVKS